MSNSKKLIRCALWGQLPIIVQIISGLIIMPKMIRYLGDKHYGIWVLVGTVLAYFGLLDMGFAKTVVRYVSYALGKDSREESDAWISVSLFLLITFSLLGFVILFGGSFILQYVATQEVITVRNLLLIAGSAFLLSLPSRCFVGVLQAHVRGDIVDGIGSAVGMLRVVGILVALQLRATLVSFVLILAATTLLQGIMITVCALRVHAGFRFKRTAITKGNLKVFLDYSGFAFVAQLADLFRFKAYPVIISSLLGISAITPFAIANQIRTMLNLVHNKVLMAFTSVFSQIEGRCGIGKELQKAYLFSYKMAVYLVVFTTGLAAIVGPKFIYRWIGPDNEKASVLLLISLVGGAAACIQIPTVCLLFGLSQHRFYAISNSIEAFLIVLTAIYLARPFGLVGLVAGASASTFLVKTFVQPFWVVRVLGIPFWSLHLNHTLPNVFKVVVFLLLCWIVENTWVSPTYCRIGTMGLLASLSFSFYILMIGFSSGERRQLIRALPFLGRCKMCSDLLQKCSKR